MNMKMFGSKMDKKMKKSNKIQFKIASATATEKCVEEKEGIMHDSQTHMALYGQYTVSEQFRRQRSELYNIIRSTRRRDE